MPPPERPRHIGHPVPPRGALYRPLPRVPQRVRLSEAPARDAGLMPLPSERAVRGPAWRVASEEQRLQLAWAKRRENDARYGWSNAGHVFNMRGRERAMLRALTRQGYLPLAGKAVLEVGCATGHWLGNSSAGARGRRRHRDRLAAEAHCRSAAPVPAGRAAGVRQRRAVALERERVRPRAAGDDAQLRSRSTCEAPHCGRDAACREVGGVILWYDFHMNNPRNPDVRGIRKREIRALFPDCALELHCVTLAPPVARWLAPRSHLVASVLGCVPLFRTHYLGVLRPSA